MSKPLLITAGEPAGVGPELCLKLFDCDESLNLIAVADPDLMQAQARMLDIPVAVDVVTAGDYGRAGQRRMRVIPFRFPNVPVPGQLDRRNVEQLINGLCFATDACLRHEFGGLITAPLQKSIINDAGTPFSGHTEFLAARCGVDTPVMLLVAGDFRVALATTHLPLKDVPAAITAETLERVIHVLHRDLRRRFGIDDPVIAVCGLNPHAGENGHLGTEEQTVISPLIERLKASGIRLRGPLPADTLFTPAGGRYDAALAMYHDQGLPVLKHAGFGNAVNVTLGLPIVRTSVDHGTALDIAGSGRADVGSLRAAASIACDMARQSVREPG